MTQWPTEQIPPTRWARTVDGACIAYQDIGRGPAPLVVIHGWVSHLEVYWEQPRYVRFLKRLSRTTGPAALAHHRPRLTRKAVRLCRLAHYPPSAR